MAEAERTRERERPTIAQTPYDIFMRRRQEFHERQQTGPVVIKPADREFQMTRQGRLMYHLNPDIHKDTPLQDWRVFSHDIKTQSGRHRHQGGRSVNFAGGPVVLLPRTLGGVNSSAQLAVIGG